MKHILPLLGLLLSAPVFSQTDKQPDKPKKLQLGISFSPDICYRSLFITEDEQKNEMILKSRNSQEVPNFGYHFGLGVCYNFRSWLGLESGVQLLHHTYSLKYMTLNPLTPEPGLPEQVKTYYHSYHVYIPLRVNFYAGKKKVRFISNVGLSADVFLTEYPFFYYKYSDGHVEKQKGTPSDSFKKVIMSVGAGAGIEYRIIPRLSLRAEPEFRYNVIGIIDAPITARLWYGGINTGLYVGL